MEKHKIKFIPVLRLVRLEENFQYGTFGILLINSEVFCVTLEPADLLNRENVSCIPALQYIIRKWVSPQYGETFRILNVPDRTDTEFHPGNTIKNTLGCIILAQHYGKLMIDGVEKRAVLNSGETFKKFMDIMKDYESGHLTIVEHY